MLKLTKKRFSIYFREVSVVPDLSKWNHPVPPPPLLSSPCRNTASSTGYYASIRMTYLVGDPKV